MSVVVTGAGSPPEPWLQTLDAIADHASDIEVVETPLSWVFLMDWHAYKVKKPIDFGEARFKVPARRRQACMDELRLNQRLAPGVYLGVIPVSNGQGGRLRLNGQGTAVDWVVKMRRLPAERNLLALFRRGEVTADEIAAVGETLAAFYQSRPPETVLLDEYHASLRHRTYDSAEQLERLLPAAFLGQIHAIYAAQTQFLAESHSLLNARVGDGRIIDGHGDLRPEHIFLERRATVIDCLEYSASLRQVDALDDLCFLAMECDYLGRADAARSLLSTYARRTGDRFEPSMASFYKSCRACVRAQVAAWWADNRNGESSSELMADAAGYLAHAQRYVSEFR